MRRLRAVILIVLCELFELPSGALCQQDEYPWVHYFQRPDFPKIQCAFADADGNVIASTGDWDDGYYDWSTGDAVHVYWSEGIFRIREDGIEGIECPASTLVLDFATDSAGRTWVLFGEGLDYRVHVDDPHWRRGLMLLDSAARSQAIANRRIGLIENGRVAVDDELTKTIPAEAFVMASDPQGRIYVMSQELRNNVSVEFFISWWQEDPSVSLHVLDLHDMLPNASVADYPQFGPDGLACFLVRCPISGHTEYALLALDPESGEHHVYFGADYPLLSSAIRWFHVDSMNIKWFGTEDGLVRFDGETWTR